MSKMVQHDVPSTSTSTGALNSQAFIPVQAPHPLEAEAWKSNFVVSESTRTDLREIRDSVQEALALQEVEVANARAALDRHLERERALNSRITKLDSGLAAHKKLPPELLSKIFLMNAEYPLRVPPPLKNDGGERAPTVNLAVTAVCSLWREVALSTQELWKSVSLSYYMTPRSTSRYQGPPQHSQAAQPHPAHLSSQHPPIPAAPSLPQLPPHPPSHPPSAQQAMIPTPPSLPPLPHPQANLPPPLPPLSSLPLPSHPLHQLAMAQGPPSLPYYHHPQYFMSPLAILNYDKVMSAAREIVSRGSTQIIEIRVLTPPMPSISSTILDPAHRLILPFASQFTHITLVCPSYAIRPFLMASPPLFRVLESVTLQADGLEAPSRPVDPQVPGENTTTTPTFMVFRNAPLLRRFTVNRFTEKFLQSFSHPVPNLAWTQLTHISLPGTWIALTTAHSIIALSVRMVHCDLSIMERALHLTSNIGPIRHPHLETLMIIVMEDVFEEFLNPLILPSLTMLKLHRALHSNGTPPQPSSRATAQGITTFVTRSRCALRAFAFRGFFTLTEPDLDSVLSILSPSIRVLALPIIPFDDSRLFRVAQGTLLPRLENMICVVSELPGSFGHFMKMMLRGAPGGNPSLPPSISIQKAQLVQGYAKYTGESSTD